MPTPVLITFDVDSFRSVTKAAGDQTIEQIAARTGLDIALVSRLLAGKRQPTFATAARCAGAYGVLMDRFAKWSNSSEIGVNTDEDAA